MMDLKIASSIDVEYQPNVHAVRITATAVNRETTDIIILDVDAALKFMAKLEKALNEGTDHATRQPDCSPKNGGQPK